MTQEQQHQKDDSPLPRNRAAVDWWLKKWGRQAVIDKKEPLNREDVEQLIVANGGTAEGLSLNARDLNGANLSDCNLNKATLNLSNLRATDCSGADLADTGFLQADLREANLLGTNLKGARLCLARLQGTNLYHADLHDANLEGAQISSDTDLVGVAWGPKYMSILEKQARYDEAISLYRRLKEWYHYAGMSTVAGEFHYREREANRKLRWQRLGNDFKDYKRQMAIAWQRFAGKDVPNN